VESDEDDAAEDGAPTPSMSPPPLALLQPVSRINKLGKKAKLLGYK